MDESFLFFVLIFSLVGLSIIAFFLLAKKMAKLKRNNYIVNKLSYAFLGFLFFIMLEGISRILVLLGKVGMIPNQFLSFANYLSNLEIIPIAGLLFMTIYIVYLLLEANIDLLAKYEDNVSGFLRIYSTLSKEIEQKNTDSDKHKKKE
jgi:hypothetical protein